LNTGLSYVGGLFGIGGDKAGAAEGIQQEVMANKVSKSNHAIYEGRSSTQKTTMSQTSDTFQVYVNNPKDGMDIEKELRKVEQRRRNRQYEDDE
jgi:hypothetical protein